jgi:succinate dehydrogenase / fumarate reductase iron-sulfur subunit
MIRLKVFRFNPDKEESSHYTTYELDCQDPSLLMALRKVRDKFDASLAFRDYHCAKGLCGSCRVRVNGKTLKACETILESGQTYLIEPLKSKPIIKDLVVKESSKQND